MAPKKKSKSGKGAKGSAGIIDGIPISEMSREQLESFVSRIQLELEREREERNFFQLERDKIRTFWEITRQQLEESRACLKNREKEFEDAEVKYRQEMKICQQNIKHFMYEQHGQLSQMELKNMIMLKNAEENHAKEELSLLKDIRELKAKNLEEEDFHLRQIRSKIQDTDQTVALIRSNYEDNCRILEQKYQRFLEQFREELSLKNEIEVNEIEERKNKYVKMLLESHDKIYDDIMHFYTEITSKNLALISVLKDKLIKMKDEKCRMLIEIQNIRKQNQELVLPLKIAQKCVEELQHKVINNEKARKANDILEKQLLMVRTKCEELQYLSDFYEFSCEQVKNEKEELQRKMILEFLQLQEKTSRQNILMERKLIEFKSAAESKDAEIIDAFIADDRSNATINMKKMQNIMNEKNDKILTLTKELTMIMKSHSDVIQSFKEALETADVNDT